MHCTNLRPNLTYVPNATLLRFSKDGGRTFSSQLIPTDIGHFMLGYGAGPGTVLSDGTFVAPIGEWKSPNEGNDIPPSKDPPNVVLKVMRVTDAQPNWPLTVDVVTVADIFMSLQRNGSAIAYSAADVGGSPFRDRLYLTWPDTRSGHFQVFFSYSTDKGRTWSHPRVIDDHSNDQCTNLIPDDIHGPVAVNAQGVVAVMWFDRCDHPGNLGWTVRMRASLDGGETFLRSIVVSAVSYDPQRTEPIPVFEMNRAFFGATGDVSTKLGLHEFQFSGGDTVGLTADAAGDFHPLWIGNQTGVPQLWTATVSVIGTVAKNGSSDLAGLVNITQDVKLIYLNRFFSRRSGALDLDLQIENESSVQIRAPLKIRVLNLAPGAGAVRIVDTNAGGTSEGAVWDFSNLLPGGILEAHKRTAPKHLHIKLEQPNLVPQPSDIKFVTPLVEFSTEVLAGGKGSGSTLP
jgi:hypothetical protein